MLRLLFCLAFLGISTSYSLKELQQHASDSKQRLAAEEMLYLPNGTALDVISFGYKNVLSNVLWFNTISYFGGHYKTDRNYEWLEHMCSLVTDLNPRAEHVFTFCGTMLAWEVEDVSAAMRILSKAIESDPTYWRYYYLRGFTSMYFLEDAAAAHEDLSYASTLPDAPAFIARLAAAKMSSSDPASAIDFLKNVLETTEDPYQRASLEDKLKQIQSKLAAKKAESK